MQPARRLSAALPTLPNSGPGSVTRRVLDVPQRERPRRAGRDRDERKGSDHGEQNEDHDGGLAHQACRQKQSLLYRRVPELVTALDRARDKGTHARLMGRLARVDLLVLDDWGLQGFSTEGRRDLLEIAEARHGRKSILIASQIPVERWPEVIGEPTIADAVLDRIVHNAYRIYLKGESQRKRNRPPPLDGGSDK